MAVVNELHAGKIDALWDVIGLWETTAVNVYAHRQFTPKVMG